MQPAVRIYSWEISFVMQAVILKHVITITEIAEFVKKAVTCTFLITVLVILAVRPRLVNGTAATVQCLQYAPVTQRISEMESVMTIAISKPVAMTEVTVENALRAVIRPCWAITPVMMPVMFKTVSGTTETALSVLVIRQT